MRLETIWFSVKETLEGEPHVYMLCGREQGLQVFQTPSLFDNSWYFVFSYSGELGDDANGPVIPIQPEHPIIGARISSKLQSVLFLTKM